MRLFIQYFCLAVVFQLIFSELLTINGFQPNIMLLFVILSQMSQSNTSKAITSLIVNLAIISLFLSLEKFLLNCQYYLSDLKIPLDFLKARHMAHHI